MFGTHFYHETIKRSVSIFGTLFNNIYIKKIKSEADENFAIARHIAINKLKNEHSCKRGIKAKRKKAGWDNEYLIKVLTT